MDGFYSYLRHEKDVPQDEAIEMVQAVAAFRDFCKEEEVEVINL